MTLLPSVWSMDAAVFTISIWTLCGSSATFVADILPPHVARAWVFGPAGDMQSQHQRDGRQTPLKTNASRGQRRRRSVLPATPSPGRYIFVAKDWHQNYLPPALVARALGQPHRPGPQRDQADHAQPEQPRSDDSEIGHVGHPLNATGDRAPDSP